MHCKVTISCVVERRFNGECSPVLKNVLDDKLLDNSELRLKLRYVRHNRKTLYYTRAYI
jgi:hypothetical protein